MSWLSTAAWFASFRLLLPRNADPDQGAAKERTEKETDLIAIIVPAGIPMLKLGMNRAGLCKQKAQHTHTNEKCLSDRFHFAQR